MNWIEFNKSFKEFSDLKRNIPGVVMEVILNDKRKLLLIGDVNESGTRAGKKKLNDETVVTRYKYVWGRWEPGKQSH